MDGVDHADQSLRFWRGIFARLDPRRDQGRGSETDLQPWAPRACAAGSTRKPATYFDSLQGRTTAASRQILVTHVGVKSPADGVMQVDDVILGAGGKPFTDDARKSIAAAIQEAEKESNGGILKLTRWRAGKTEEVQLKLRVMGTYSDTAPYDCPKSKRILEEACKVLEKEPLEENWHGAINGLALLATGKPEYLPRLREFARKIGPKTLKLELKARDGDLGMGLPEPLPLRVLPPHRRQGGAARHHMNTRSRSPRGRACTAPSGMASRRDVPMASSTARSRLTAR